MSPPVCIADFRERARAFLPEFLFGYLDGGSLSEATQRDNEAAFERLRLRQFVLRDVSDLSVSGQLLGQSTTLPLALAPVGLAGLMHTRGEVQAARAAEAFGVPYCHSTVGLCSIEEVRAATQKPFWFQLYMLRDRGVVLEMLQRAKAAGCSALVFTVDLARLGVRYSDLRHGVGGARLAQKIARVFDILRHPRWVVQVALRGRPLVFGNLTEYVPRARDPEGFKAWVDAQFDPGVTFRDIEWLRQHWDGPLLLKGILEAEDATRAFEIGAQGVVVSNHGGRQLDGALASIDALSAIVDAVDGRGSVIVDGGVRYGTDIIKACALGANGVMIGRPWAWALAAGGGQAVTAMLQMLDQEARNSLGLMGHTQLSALRPDALASGPTR